jgi:uncharacterized damage-inducible protein DinB
MKTQLSSILENSRTYTLAVAEAMPENLYDFRPTEEVWNFNELVNHIAYGIEWWHANYIKKTEQSWSPPVAKNTKRETIKFLQQSYDGLLKTLDSEKLSDESVKGFWATLDHITHHRGQAVLHLRLNKIAPPEYAF